MKKFSIGGFTSPLTWVARTHQIVAKKILRHLHPNAATAIVVEEKTSEYPLVGIVYGAKRIWLNATRESREPFEVVATLHCLGVLQENWYDGNSYFAMEGEWTYSKDSTIYVELSPKPELRREWHKASGLKVAQIYLPEK